jgi:hypothetical protein
VDSGVARGWGLEGDGYVAGAAVVGDRERKSEMEVSIGRKERAETGKRRKRTTSVEERARSRSQRQARIVLPSAKKWRG